MKDIYEEIVRIQREGKRAALASLVWSLGSVPTPRGAKMLVYEDGRIAGSVGGGCLEAEVWQCAQDVMVEGKGKLLYFELTEQQAAESGFICGGRAKVLVEPILPGLMTDVFAAVQEVEKRRQKAVLATLYAAEGTTVQRLERVLLREDGSSVGRAEEEVLRLAGEMLAAAPHEEPLPKHVRVGESAEAVLERLVPRATALIFGAGHVGIALAQMAAIAGFRVVVLDDREAFANRQRLPFADEVMVAEFEAAFKDLDIDEYCYVVVVTRGHLYDREVVEQALRTRAGYIGMIGSRRKIKITFSQLEGKGFSREEIERIHAPIGLDIGAETAQEIAVAILAEMIRQMRRPDSAGR